MQTKTICICQSCNNPIFNPKDGVIVHGNIYVADPDEKKGLIGDCFPSSNSFTIEEVSTVAYCRICFLKAIEWPDFLGPTSKSVNAWKSEEEENEDNEGKEKTGNKPGK